jgi:hypothetical protein
LCFFADAPFQRLLQTLHINHTSGLVVTRESTVEKALLGLYISRTVVHFRNQPGLLDETDMKRAIPKPVAGTIPRYLTLKEAAVYLSLSAKSLYRLVDSRRIPFTAINISTRQPDGPKRVHYRFDRLALDAFMAENSVVPPGHLAHAMPRSSKMNDH